MNVRPTIGQLSSIPELEAMLEGLRQTAMVQFRGGTPSVSKALHEGRLKYIRRDSTEHWRTPREIWAAGGGDCEDLAAAVAAERTLAGSPSIVQLVRTGPKMLHAVVWDGRTGKYYDPSITGGMGRP